MPTIDTYSLTLTATNSGQIIYSQHTTMPAFRENLPDGYNCTIVNYSNGTYTSNALSSTKFYSSAIGNAGATTFTIPPGGTVNVYDVTKEVLEDILFIKFRAMCFWSVNHKNWKRSSEKMASFLSKRLSF